MRLPKLLVLTAIVSVLLAGPGAVAQQIRGTPGAPDAVVTPKPFSLPAPTPPFTGTTMPNVGDSQGAWPPQVAAPEGAPNVLVILTDDVGFGAPSTFGGVIPTPALARIAQEGLRYTQFHTTALCSPTRAALLMGRNHHSYPAHKGLTLGVEPTRSVVIHRRAWLRGVDHAGADDPGGRAAE